MSEPRVTDYTDFRAFLKDWFDYKKKTEYQYSHRRFAKRAASTDSSILLRVINGQRSLPPNRIPDFCRALGLEGADAECFELLVNYQQASPEMAEHAAAALVEFHIRRGGPSLEGDQLRFVHRWIYPAIFEMAACRGFRLDPARVGAWLRPPISPDAAAEALELLFRLGLLEKTEDGVRTNQPFQMTSRQVHQVGTLGYHQDTHRLAGEALQRIWAREPGADEQTAFMGCNVAVPSSRMKEVRVLIHKLQMQLAAGCEALEGESDMVLQINIHAFPVSEVIPVNPGESE